jgi:hypothetical protein
MLRFVLRRAFVCWWCAAVSGWMLVVEAGWDRSADLWARVATTLAPLWAMPWHGPLATLRALGAGGEAEALAFLTGLAGCALVDRVRAHTRAAARRTRHAGAPVTRARKAPLRLVRPPSLTPTP